MNQYIWGGSELWCACAALLSVNMLGITGYRYEIFMGVYRPTMQVNVYVTLSVTGMGYISDY